MPNWIEQYNESSPKTKSFILTWFIYGLALVVTTAYCYGRLDFVRSYKSPAVTEAKKIALLEATNPPQQNP